MYDALEDTPRDFQTKLIDTLNSLGETMQIPPTEAFNKVLCKSSDDENEDVKKKLYNWWRAFFEVLGKCEKVPTKRVSEFNQKIDDLMAEIMKAGDAEASTEEEPVMESSEQFSDEEIMRLLDRYTELYGWDIQDVRKALDGNISPGFRWAVEQALPVAGHPAYAALVNRMGPVMVEIVRKNKIYKESCKGQVNEVMSYYEPPRKLTPIGKRTKPQFKRGDIVVNSYDERCRVINVRWDKFEGNIYEVWNMDDKSTIDVPESKLRGSTMNENYEQATKDDEDKMMADMDFAIQHLGEVANKVKAIVNFINPYCEKTFNEENNTMKFKKIDEHVDYSNDVYNRFKVGDVVSWKDENDEMQDGWTVVGYDEISLEYHLKKDDKDVFVDDVRVEEYNESKVNEANVVVDANDVWSVLELLDDETAKKNLTDLINSHVRTEEEIMDAIDSYVEVNWHGKVKKQELNKIFTDWMYLIVGDLGLDVDKYRENGEFVDEGKPTSVELESGKGGETKKVSLYVDWDDDGAGIDKNVVIDVPTEIADSEESTALYDYIMNWIDHQDFCVNDWAITDIEGLDSDVELEGTDWKDITEKLTAAELADSLNGWEDRSKKLVVCDAYASGSDIVNVDVLTVTDKRDEVMKMASEYLLGNVENWQVGDASEPRKDENGQFYTELILEPVYEGVLENSDEVKSGEVKDGDKQVTQDGETKTLVAGEENKKPVCEMTIEQDINNAWNLAEYLWGQGKENLEELLRIKLVDGDAILQLLEDMGERNLTSINDLFAYDFPSVLDSLGLDGHAWSQNLEFKRKGEDEDDEGEDEG